MDAEPQSFEELPHKILVVDDEPFNLKSFMIIIKSSLKEMGLNDLDFKNLIHYAQNGQEALDKVKKSVALHQYQYSLIISDCQMPVMDGYTSCT